MKNRAKLVEKIEAVNAELENVDRHQDYNKWSDLENKRIKLIHDLADVDLLQSINNLTEENSMREFLDSSTKTVQLMTKFKNSDKQFLIFNQFLSVEIGNKPYVFSLVVTRTKELKGVVDKLTISELKEYGGFVLGNNFWSALNLYHPEDHIYMLLKEIESIRKKGVGNKKNIPFSKPCSLRAQTNENLKGYGNKYSGRALVKEGTKYGETTGFAIIGVTLTWHV